MGVSSRPSKPVSTIKTNQSNLESLLKHETVSNYFLVESLWGHYLQQKQSVQMSSQREDPLPVPVEQVLPGYEFKSLCRTVRSVHAHQIHCQIRTRRLFLSLQGQARCQFLVFVLNPFVCYRPLRAWVCGVFCYCIAAPTMNCYSFMHVPAIRASVSLLRLAWPQPTMEDPVPSELQTHFAVRRLEKWNNRNDCNNTSEYSIILTQMCKLTLCRKSPMRHILMHTVLYIVY